MQSMFINRGDTQLYGVFQKPSGGGLKDYAVLMCYPFGQEYMRAHRAFRQLGNMLARKGIPSLRFDYQCSGDSSGELADFSISQACTDIKTAFRELKALSGTDKVYVIGLRLGAAMSMMALADMEGVEHVTLWDPVINGKAYCDELYASMDPEFHKDLIIGDTWWVNGFPATQKLREEIMDIDLCKMPFGKRVNMFQVVSERKPEYAEFERYCDSSGVSLQAEFQRGPSDDDWNRVDTQGSFLLPHLVLNSIVSAVI